MRIRRLTLYCAVILVSGLVHPLAALVDEPLTNEQIIQMIQAKISTSTIIKTIESAPAIKLDTSPAALIALKKAGADDALIEVLLDVNRARGGGASLSATVHAPEKSDLLRDSKEPDFILRNFRTMFVNASAAQFFGSAQMKGALGADAEFRALGISIVDDRAVADTVLEVSYTFAWDYPFTLKHQNTSLLLLSGKATGPFSGPKGASNVAKQLARMLKPYRTALPSSKKGS